MRCFDDAESRHAFNRRTILVGYHHLKGVVEVYFGGGLQGSWRSNVSLSDCLFFGMFSSVERLDLILSQASLRFDASM